MEIQTFFLAEKIDSNGNRHDVKHAGLAILECFPPIEFPACFALPFFLQLRRQTTEGEAPFRLRFDLVDEDGRPTGQPRRLVMQGLFPDGKWVYDIVAPLNFEFPGPGHYRLDITVNDVLEDGVYHYGFDIVPRKGR